MVLPQQNKKTHGSCHKNQENESDICVHTKFMNFCKVDFLSPLKCDFF